MPELNKTVAPPHGMERRDVMDTIKDQAKDITAGAERMAGAAKEKVKETAGAAREKVSEAATAAREKVSEAATAAGELAVQAKDKVREWSVTAADEAREVVQEGMQEVTSLVRRYPIQSLLVGVAVGFLLARATTRS